LERVKAVQRNASAAAEAGSYRPELIADVREQVQKKFGVSLENEVVVWNA